MSNNRRSPAPIQTQHILCLATMIVGLALSLEPARPAQAATFTVTKTADTNDGACNADCSLREAIVAANAAAGADRIILPAGTYTLTIAGQEDFAAQGDLDLNGDLTLAGAGADVTTIYAGGLDRVFDIPSARRVTLSGLTISGGDTAATGGGILNQGTLTVTNSTLSGNLAGSGGGIFNSASGALTLLNTTVSGNSAVSGGGGLSSGGSVTVTNSTFSGNSAAGSGGGLNFSFGTAQLMNDTITNNTGGDGGGIHNGTSGAIQMRNTLLAGNMATGGATAGPDCAEGLITLPIISQGYNLVGDDTNCSFASSTGDQVGTGGSPIDPRLGPLHNNGGPTLTHALRPDSPAIDAGNPLAPGSGGGSHACEAADQRGLARAVDGDGDGVARCDIGAFEMNYTLAVDRADDLAPASMCTPVPNDCSLRGAIRAANSSPAYDIILVPAGSYTLTIPGSGENAALTGDLDITSNLALTGAGTVTINGNGAVTGDRVFHVIGAVTVTISNVTIRGGYNIVAGGGLLNGLGRVTLQNTSLVSNTGLIQGGGIYNSGALTVTNSTLSGNTAGAGGGLWHFSGAVTLNNVTVASNTVTTGNGGGIVRDGGTVTLFNTLVAGNSDAGGQAPDCAGILTSQGHNLIGNDTGCSFSGTTGDQVGSGANPIDPRLGPLQDNGGFTPTQGLQRGSSAIDAGDNATCAVADQRGVARPFGPACDIGAYEFDVYALYMPLIRR